MHFTGLSPNREYNVRIRDALATAAGVACLAGALLTSEEDDLTDFITDANGVLDVIVYIPLAAALGVAHVYATVASECSPGGHVTIEDQSGECDGPYSGGLQRYFPTVPAGCERHHVPAHMAYPSDWKFQGKPLVKTCRPIIVMKRADHYATGSWGSHTESDTYRSAQRAKLAQGDLLGAFNMDDADLRAKFPDGRYNAALDQAREHIETRFLRCLKGELGSQGDGPPGTLITAFATGARASRQFFLVTANAQGEPGHDAHACMFNVVNANPNPRTSSSSGFIPNTTGRVERSPGIWQVCFREPSGATATIPVHFTVT
ncbi:MAG: hypothetical protein AB1673_02525 [Actinomycetota bacterium]